VTAHGKKVPMSSAAGTRIALLTNEPLATAHTTGEIWAIYVKPEHWDKGVGVALWDAAREGLEEEGCTVVTIWVPLRNDRALRFVELAGFKREMKTAKTSVLADVKIEEVRLKRSVS
ncbi:MAG: GNAT family N-acetyltransferase, partial [Comamonadaceae bacterium]